MAYSRRKISYWPHKLLEGLELEDLVSAFLHQVQEGKVEDGRR
jgi:hypothetical protein